MLNVVKKGGVHPSFMGVRNVFGLIIYVSIIKKGGAHLCFMSIKLLPCSIRLILKRFQLFESIKKIRGPTHRKGFVSCKALHGGSHLSCSF